MSLIQATYDVNTEKVTVNGIEIEYGKYWRTQDTVSDEEGIWDSELEIFTPNGYFNTVTGYINKEAIE